jgi:hypothetical protein
MMHINWNLINIFLLGLQVKHPGHEIHDPLFRYNEGGQDKHPVFV